MRLTIPRGVLLDAIRGAQRAVPRKPSLPILNTVLLDAQDRLCISGTDLSISATVSVDAQIDAFGRLAIPASTLAELVANLPEGPVHLEVTDYHLVVTAQDSPFRGRLAGVDASEYVLPGDLGPILATASISQADLNRIRTDVGFAASSDQTRLSLNGVLWERSRKHLVAVATDGYRLSRIELSQARIDPTEGVAAAEQWIVPVQALAVMLPLAGQEVTVEMYERDLAFRSATEGSISEARVVSRTVEGPYPNYRQVFPRAFSRTITVPRQELMATVRRVATLASRSTHQVRLSFLEGRLEVTACNMDVGGEGRDSMTAALEGDPIEVGFNAVYLLEILGMLSTPTATIRLNEPTQACQISSTPVNPGDPPPDGATFILMPLRLAE